MSREQRDTYIICYQADAASIASDISETMRFRDELNDDNERAVVDELLSEFEDEFWAVTDHIVELLLGF